MLFRLLIALLVLTSPAIAAPGDPWEGVWKNDDHKILWLTQDGDRVYGISTRPIRYEGRVSPDGRTLRGTWFIKEHNQGLFEWILEADGQSFIGAGIGKGASATNVPDATLDTNGGDRHVTDLMRSDFDNNGFGDPSHGLSSVFNPNNTMHAAWIAYQSPYAQTAAPRVDIDDLPVPDPGTAGLWQVIDQNYGHIGTVAMDEDALGFTAAGQVRLPDFQGGTPLLATFTEYSNNQTLDEASFQIVLSGDTQFQIVNIRPSTGEAFDITFGGGFAGVDSRTMRLVWIEGSIPPPDPVDLSQLETPAPGNLGLMRVTTSKHGEIGTVNWNQDAATLKVTMEGQIVIPELAENTPLDVVIFEGPALLDDAISLSNPASGLRVTMPVPVQERDGDHYVVTLPASELSPSLSGDYILHITHIPGSRPSTGTPPQEDLYTLRVDTARVPAGLAVLVYDAPMRDAGVIGMLQNDATGLTLRECAPQLTDTQLRLNDEDLYNVMADRFCLITAPGVGGWVGGTYLIR